MVAGFKVLTWLLLVAGLSNAIEVFHAAPKVQDYQYKTVYFDQKVDHFNFVNTDIFKQRILINDSYWDAGKQGPIFFYTGNEGDIEAFAQNSGFMWDIAPEFNALLIFAEHRYYGQSLPYGADSTKPDPKYVGYLTSEQALADYADFLSSFKETTKGAAASSVIAFGGSYGGMLAAWFRIKYPHICNGAIAASAPVAQFTAPCDAFGRIVTADFSQQSEKCSSTIRKSWGAIDNLTSTDDGLKWVNDAFKLCTPLKTKDDATKLKGYLNDLWTNLVMMDYPYPTSFLMPLPGNPVKYSCGEILDNLNDSATTPQDIIKPIVAGASVYYNFTGATKCLNLDSGDDIGADMWDYQACSEMVMPFCFDGVADMFEKSLWNFTQVKANCEAKWKVSPNPKMADINYGSKKLDGASNIVFSNGLLDPWSSGGILRSVSSTVVSLLIPEGAHHLDLRGANPNDPPSVISARKLEKQYIAKWIGQATKRKLKMYGPESQNFVV